MSSVSVIVCRGREVGIASQCSTPRLGAAPPWLWPKRRVRLARRPSCHGPGTRAALLGEVVARLSVTLDELLDEALGVALRPECRAAAVVLLPLGRPAGVLGRRGLLLLLSADHGVTSMSRFRHPGVPPLGTAVGSSQEDAPLEVGDLLVGQNAGGSKLSERLELSDLLANFHRVSRSVTQRRGGRRGIRSTEIASDLRLVLARRPQVA